MTSTTTSDTSAKVEETVALIKEFGPSGLTGLLGIRIRDYEPGRFVTDLPLRDELLLTAGNLLHAGTALTLADTTTGWGCMISLPETAGGFTTIEGKGNFVATARAHDVLVCTARLVHGGRTTQVWDAEVVREADDRLVATYRCTQSLIEQVRQ